MIDLAPVPNRLYRPDTLEDDADMFFAKLPQYGADLLAIQSNVASNAAGGAYAVPYKFSSNSANIGKGGYLTSPQNGYLYFDDLDLRGINGYNYLTSALTSTSSVKAFIKITAVNDITRWQALAVTANYAHGGGASNGNVGYVFLNGNGGFVEGESVQVQISRVGDKGDPTPIGTALLRDQKASGGAAQSLAAGLNTRVLNQANVNEIGLVLSANQFTLPPGKYILEASAPATCSGNLNQQLRLFNVTAASMYDVGTNEYTYAGNSAAAAARAHLKTVLIAGVTATYRLDHWVSIAGSGGAPNSAGIAEVYAEVRIAKYA